MKENPINEILRTSIQNIEELIDSSKVVGTPIMLPNNAVAIPISKVVYGYGVGGSQFENKKTNNKIEIANEIYPFGGGSGGGVTITPTAFIIIKDDNIKMLSVDKDSNVLPKIIDTIKEMIKK